MSDDEVIVLRKYSSEVEATMAHLVLEAHNIPSAVMRDTAGGMIPSMALLYPVRLAVRREDADEARTDSGCRSPAAVGGRRRRNDRRATDFAVNWTPDRDLEDDDEDEGRESDSRW